MSLEVEGFGSTLGYSSDLTTYGSPTTVTKMIEFEPPVVEADTLQTSSFSTTGQTHTYQAGWKKPSKGKCTILFDKTVIAALEGLIGTMKGWLVTYADGSTRKFNGFIVKTGEKVPMDKLVTYEFEIQASGAVAFTAGS